MLDVGPKREWHVRDKNESYICFFINTERDITDQLLLFYFRDQTFQSMDGLQIRIYTVERQKPIPNLGAWFVKTAVWTSINASQTILSSRRREFKRGT